MPKLIRDYATWGDRKRHLVGYQYKDWYISSRGGHGTFKRYVAEKGDEKGDDWHWAFTLKECVAFCDSRDNGQSIHDLYTKPLYN